MGITYGQAVALAVPVFLALIAVELIAALARGRRSYGLADSINSLSCGIISTGMRVFFGFLGLFFYEWVLRHAAVVRLPASHWGTWVFAFFGYDLCYYWNHRLGHTVGLFWAAHVVHHQSEEFNLTTALRQPGTGAFTSWLFYLPLALCGVPVPVYLAVGLVQLFYQFWPHTEQIGRLGFLDRWIQTPSNHRVHHAQNDLYLDRNYVGVFCIWDRLFGTFQEEMDEEPCIYGIRGQLRSWNPVWANLHYYQAMAQDSRRARHWGDKVRVWFSNPGWRPADVAARYPKPPYDPRRDFVRYDPPRSLALSLYALAQFTAVMAANMHFLKLLPALGTALSVGYFALIVTSLVCVGGVLENRRAFLIADAVRLAAIGIGAVWAPWLALYAPVSLVWLWTAVRPETPRALSARRAA